MKTNLLAFVLFFAFFYSNSNAQEFKLGKVSVAELEEKEHPKDPGASAAILFKKGEVKFRYSDTNGFEVVTVVQTRIKIYKKEGYEWANQEVQYYLDNSYNENVSFSDAYTYNLVNGKIEKTKLKSDGEFIEKINKYVGRKKITMPNVKEGSVIEFEYSIKTGLIGSLRDWYFQSSIPVNYSEYITYIPEYFEYNSNQKGFVLLETAVEKINRKVNYVYVRDYKDGTPPIRSNEELNFIEKKTTYSIKDLPALKEEAFVNNIDNYTSSISHELSMTNYPNSTLKYYSTDWASVVKTINSYDDFGPELNKTGYFEADISKLLTGITAENERIAAIFNYVKNSIKWNKYKGYSCNDGVKTAYKNKIGNTGEINLMLTAMLRFAGLNANPVLISTRDNGIAFFPSRTAFNSVIAAVETPGGLILLDATEKYSEPNILPLRDLNWVGRLIRKDGTSTEVNLMPKILSREATNMSIVLKTEGSAEGKIRRQLTDYEALEFRKENADTNKDSYLEKLESSNNNIEISDYVRENDLDLSKPIVESYSFIDTKSIEIINDKIYISPMLFLAAKENPFKQEVREYPVDFGYPNQSKYNINLEIPQGYVVESMPTSINIATGDDIGTFKLMMVNTDNKIQTTITSTINTAIVPSDFYPVLKGYYQQMIDKQNEKIVLKKI
jgi:transglutaminase-like putative cysteine protease